MSIFILKLIVEGELFKIDSFVRYHKYCERYKKEKLINCSFYNWLQFISIYILTIENAV